MVFLLGFVFYSTCISDGAAKYKYLRLEAKQLRIYMSGTHDWRYSLHVPWSPHFNVRTLPGAFHAFVDKVAELVMREDTHLNFGAACIFHSLQPPVVWPTFARKCSGRSMLLP